MSKTIVILASLALASTATLAKDKDKVTALPKAAAAAMTGKSLVVTRHEKPSFSAMTAGKAGFGLFGAVAMIEAGNKIVRENEVADPADVLEKNLAPAVAKHYALQLGAEPGVMVKGGSPKDLIAAAGSADYILDIESKGWNFAYYATDWNTYWLGYVVETDLLDAKSGKVLAKMSCYTDTQKHPSSPSRDAMLANNAQVIKDVTAALGWRCLHRIGEQEFALATDELPATPEEIVDPLAKLPVSLTPKEDKK